MEYVVPLTEQEMRQIADEVITDHFPGIDPEIGEGVLETALMQFDAGYSPVPQEWPEEERGVGSGVTFSDYVVFVAHV